jgi:hypothetical protein
LNILEKYEKTIIPIDSKYEEDEEQKEFENEVYKDTLEIFAGY